MTNLCKWTNIEVNSISFFRNNCSNSKVRNRRKCAMNESIDDKKSRREIGLFATVRIEWMHRTVIATHSTWDRIHVRPIVDCLIRIKRKVNRPILLISVYLLGRNFTRWHRRHTMDTNGSNSVEHFVYFQIISFHLLGRKNMLSEFGRTTLSLSIDAIETAYRHDENKLKFVFSELPKMHDTHFDCRYQTRAT